MLPASEEGRRGFGSKDGAPLGSGNSVAEGGEVEVRTPDEMPRCGLIRMDGGSVSEKKRQGVQCISEPETPPEGPADPG